MILIKTSMGDIQIQLDHITTPKTVANFLEYIEQNFYQDTVFHRVIKGFMIQGGGLTSEMKTKATNPGVMNEARDAKPNKRGSIAMARTMDPHSATAQFFINLADNDFLNYTGDHMQGYGYCVFGEVVSGMDVVDAIAEVKTAQRQGHADVPVDDVVIHSVQMLEVVV